MSMDTREKTQINRKMKDETLVYVRRGVGTCGQLWGKIASSSKPFAAMDSLIGPQSGVPDVNDPEGDVKDPTMVFSLDGMQ